MCDGKAFSFKTAHYIRFFCIPKLKSKEIVTVNSHWLTVAESQGEITLGQSIYLEERVRNEKQS